MLTLDLVSAAPILSSGASSNVAHMLRVPGQSEAPAIAGTAGHGAGLGGPHTA